MKEKARIAYYRIWIKNHALLIGILLLISILFALAQNYIFPAQPFPALPEAGMPTP